MRVFVMVETRGPAAAVGIPRSIDRLEGAPGI